MACAMHGRRKRSTGPLLQVSPAARQTMQQITEHLARLEKSGFSSPLDPHFRGIYAETIGLIERYRAMIFDGSEYAVTCRKGCCDCCCHWVEDVNSFEAEIIVDHIRQTMPGMISSIRARCAEDCVELERLESILSKKLMEREVTPADHGIDQVDLLLSLFYRMRRPCPLLSEDGSCYIYDLRPLTCRIYVSVSDPLRCDPEYIDATAIPTCIVDLSESANRILDKLHFRHMRNGGDTGLRSFLAKNL